MKLKAADRVRTAAGLEGEILFVYSDKITACVELLDGTTEIHRLDALIRINEGDKKRNR